MIKGIPSLKRRLQAAELTIGSWLSSAFPLLAEMLASSGFDWLVIDMEHTGIDFGDALSLIQVIELAGVPPLVRVGDNDPLFIKRALDSGAHGVVVPMVNSAPDAARAVDAAHYPPYGSRGAGLSRAQRFGMGFDDYREWAAREVVVIVQIEHIDAVENLDEIVAVDGVDGFIVGPYDLSASMGHPGDWGADSVVAALERVREVASRGGVIGGYHVVHSRHDELEQRIEEGYRFIAYGDDMVFLAEKLEAEAEWLATVRDLG